MSDGQGDHIISYSLYLSAVNTCVAGKTFDVAGPALAKLMESAQSRVNHTNRNWHNNAGDLLKNLKAAKANTNHNEFKRYINDVLFLLNTMPGTAIKNTKSTGGQGEASSKGGIMYGESKLSKGKPVKGNVWVNLFNLIDLNADKSLVADQEKLKNKLDWLMVLFSTAAPTTYSVLKNKNRTLTPDTNLSSAVSEKFSGKTVAETVISTIIKWINAN